MDFNLYISSGLGARTDKKKQVFYPYTARALGPLYLPRLTPARRPLWY